MPIEKMQSQTTTHHGYGGGLLRLTDIYGLSQPFAGVLGPRCPAPCGQGWPRCPDRTRRRCHHVLPEPLASCGRAVAWIVGFSRMTRVEQVGPPARPGRQPPYGALSGVARGLPAPPARRPYGWHMRSQIDENTTASRINELKGGGMQPAIAWGYAIAGCMWSAKFRQHSAE